MRSDQVACRVDLAARYGLDVAVFIQNIYYWVRKNEANQEHFYDGRYWAHSSYRGLEKWFEPLWSMQQIKRIVSKCRDQGLLLVGNYNPDGFTHTNWYSVTDAVLEIYGDSPEPEKVVRNRTIDSSILMQNRSEIEPANKVYKININKPPIVPREVLARVDEACGEDQELRDGIMALLENRKKLRKPVDTVKKIDGILNRLSEYSGGNRRMKLAMLDKAVEWDWLSVYPLKPDELPQADRGQGREEYGWQE
nr:MAG TPA: hypothetical protein [Caudoviricetes sp.]